MFARVSTYDGASDELVRGFEAQAEPLRGIEGSKGGYFLVDRGRGKAISITLWESEEALNASAERADRLREAGVDTSGAPIESVESYEVAIEFPTQ